MCAYAMIYSKMREADGSLTVFLSSHGSLDVYHGRSRLETLVPVRLSDTRVACERRWRTIAALIKMLSICGSRENEIWSERLFRRQ